MSHPVRLSALAAHDLQQARGWFDQREQGLGDRFLAGVEQTLERIAGNPEQYAVALLDLRRAAIRPYRYSLWFRVLPDASNRLTSEVSQSHGNEPEPRMCGSA